ncbi:MAG: hypothetical protein HDS52_02665 [Barnesiella sp.]|nr:hypothetical protein [Barnesiella sp.]
MTKTVSDSTREGFGMRLAKSVKSIAKLMLSTRRARYQRVDGSRPLLIMGNGPSLAATIAAHEQLIAGGIDSMAVNFAANAPEFTRLRPKYYILADPHFFANPDDANVARLLDNIRNVDWPMTLFLPFAARKNCPLTSSGNLTVEYYNAVGIEGFGPLERMAFDSRRGMPRPRNVLIPAIMTGIGMGYREIYITGADHTWTATLTVDEENHVLSRQPHFYKEDEKEERRIRKEYLRYPLHSILYSFYLAFKAYHIIEEYARSRGVTIYNATPGSMIDAFERKSLDSFIVH